jgi:LAGLIDADG endonuclease
MKHNVQDVGSRLQKPISKEFAWYITGFVDGEGCFSVSFTARAKMNTGIEVRPSFSIGQNKRSLSVLKDIHTYFGCGAIRFSKHDQLYKYEVRSVGDIQKHIIPHFKKYPLQTSKLHDFQVFSWICEQIHASRHLNRAFLQQIIEQAYTMNESGKRKYTMHELLTKIEAR